MMRVKNIYKGILSVGLGALMAGHGLCQAQETTLVASAAGVRAVEPARRNVELDLQQAWLADPITFPYYLEAQVVGSKLELRGHVPNRRVHDQALKHAFDHATINILDAIRETPGVEVRTAAMPPEQLQALATQTLQRTFGNDLTQVRVEAKSGGAIVLHGVVTNADQKRWAGQSLRHVPGCTSIVNQIEIAAHAPATPTLTQPDRTTTQAARVPAAREEPSSAEVIIITPMKGATPTKTAAPTPVRPEPVVPRAWVPPQVPSVPLPKPESSTSYAPPTASSPNRPVINEPPYAETSNTGSGVVQASHSEPVPTQASHLVPALKRRFPGVQRINVQHQKDNRVRIDLWVSTSAEGHRLISELDRMEELAPYYCETHIHHN